MVTVDHRLTLLCVGVCTKQEGVTVPTSKAPSDPPKAAGSGSGSGDAAAALAGVVVGGGAGGGAGASDAATGSGLHTIQGPTVRKLWCKLWCETRQLCTITSHILCFPQRLKDSILWDLQQAFYDKEHIKVQYNTHMNEAQYLTQRAWHLRRGVTRWSPTL